MEENKFDKLNHPAILLIGDAGVGKSTLGNYLLGYRGNDGPFKTGYTNYGVTVEPGVRLVKIKDREFNIIDTVGLFDIYDKNDAKLEKTINHCTYGIQAIIFVMRHAFGDVIYKKIQIMQDFLGEKSLDNMIIAFTYVDKEKAIDKNILKFDQNTTNFLEEKLKNRWIVSPHPDFSNLEEFLPNIINEAKDFISSFTKAYTTDMFNKASNSRCRII